MFQATFSDTIEAGWVKFMFSAMAERIFTTIYSKKTLPVDLTAQPFFVLQPVEQRSL